MTRTQGKIDGLRAAGVTPVLCDVFDQRSLVAAVKDFQPDLVVHQVTDLPDEIEKLADFLPAERSCTERGDPESPGGSAGGKRFGFPCPEHRLAQRAGTGPVLDAHESGVISAGGTVLRYGLFYGPGTFYENDPPPAPRIHVDDAARRTMPFLAGPRGTFTITDEELAP